MQAAASRPLKRALLATHAEGSRTNVQMRVCESALLAGAALQGRSPGSELDMANTVGDFLWQRLRQWGVNRVFGYPGDGINGLIGALDRSQNNPEFVQVRHEEMAAFMASAHAKFTGEVGVCLATSGPGAIHLLNGLYDARLDHQPVLAIVGQQARAALGGQYQQEPTSRVCSRTLPARSSSRRAHLPRSAIS